MKKALSILLSLAIILGCVCGCTEKDGPQTSSNDISSETVNPKSLNVIGNVSELPTVEPKDSRASNRVMENTENTPWDFDNTYYKLKTKRQLNVAYTGGSVTVGTGGDYYTDCWRVYTNQWLKESFPDAEINEINKSIGATSSSWGIARFKREVIENKPDLLFIEFSVNDVYTSLNPDTSAAIMDGMIREINAELPECEIIVVSVPDSSSLRNVSANRNAHKGAALYNGVLWLDMSVPLLAAMEKENKEWSYYVTDSVHPNPKGYRVYADYVAEQLGAKLKESAQRNPTGTVKHTVPEKPYTSNSNLRNQTLWVEDLKFDENEWKIGGEMKKPYFAGTYRTLRYKETGASLTFEFEGSSFAIFGDFKENSCVKFTLDGGNEQTIGVSRDQSGENLLYDNLKVGVKHTVTLTVEGKGLCGIVAVYIG